MKNLLRRVWEERTIIFFLLWTSTILVAGNAVKQNLKLMLPIVIIYVICDVLYYGTQTILFTRPLMKAIVATKNGGKRTITDGVLEELASSRLLIGLLCAVLVIGMLQPVLSFVVATQTGLKWTAFKMVYGYLAFDFTSTALVWGTIICKARAQRFGFIRQIKLADLDGLAGLEAVAFPDPEQQWSRDEVRRAIETSRGHSFAYIRLGRPLAAIYLRPVCSDALVPLRPGVRWSELANGGDLTSQDHADTLYGVNLLASPTNADLAEILLAQAYAETVRLGMKYLMGCVRIPGYYLHAPEDVAMEYLGRPGVEARMEARWPRVLQALRQGSPRRQGYSPAEYVHATGRSGKPVDPMIRKTLDDLTIMVLGRRIQLGVVLGCLEDYFGDPPSLDRGALIAMPNKLVGLGRLGRLAAPVVYRLMTI